jgi:hypothetical protein
MRFYARQHISWNALQIKKQLESTGEITVDENMSLSRAACEFGLNVGFNHVVVGMRSKAYVDDLAPLMKAAN